MDEFCIIAAVPSNANDTFQVNTYLSDKDILTIIQIICLVSLIGNMGVGQRRRVRDPYRKRKRQVGGGVRNS